MLAGSSHRQPLAADELQPLYLQRRAYLPHLRAGGNTPPSAASWLTCPCNRNVLLKQGDVLFRIDPRPYQFTVDEKKAALAEAKQSVRQLKAAMDAANSAVQGTLAEVIRN